MQALVFLALVLLCTGAARGQRIWTVDWQNRAGTDFTAIQPAVDAAAPGDTIHVRGAGLSPEPPGHAYAAPVIDGKGVNVIGEGAATTWITGAWTIRNVPATQSVTVARFMTGPCCLFTYFGGMTLTNNAGLVAMSEIQFENFGTRDFTDCAAVVVRNCTIPLLGGFTLASLRAIRSNVMLDGIGLSPDLLSNVNGYALYCESSKVWIVNSLIAGSDEVWPQSAQPAIRSKESEIWIGYGATVRGGFALSGNRTAILDSWQLLNFQCGPSCGFQIAPSRVHADPSAQFAGSWPIVGYTVATLEPVTSIWAHTSNGVLTVDQRCAPSSLLVLGIGPWLMPPIQGLPGLLAVDPAQAMLSWSIVSSGLQQATFPLPPSLPFGLEVGLQLLELTPQGELRLSNATVFGVW